MKRNAGESSLSSKSPTKHRKQHSDANRPISKLDNDKDVDQLDLEAFQNDLNRVRTSVQQRDELDCPDIKSLDEFDSILEAISYLRNLIQVSSLLISRRAENAFPPIVWRHHLYALFSSHTKVDTELETLCCSNQIRILNVAASTRNADIIIQLDDFCKYFIGRKKNLLIELFISKIVKAHTKTKYSTNELNQVGFGEAAIDKFMNLGLLTCTDSSLTSRQLSFPGLGVFIRTLHDGRKALLGLIRKCKYSQILQSDLLRRSVPKCNSGKDLLGIELHLYDIYGADLVGIERLSNDVLIRITN